MAPRGFEPPTPGYLQIVRVRCSDQAELRNHDYIENMRFKSLMFENN